MAGEVHGTVGAIMVVGGGISGMQSALDLADSGFKVYLVDESTSIGGIMAQLDKTFPTNDCSMCIMAPKLVTTGRHHNIEIITNAVVQGVTGSPGNFKVTINKKPRRIDETKCTGCGVCAQKCLASSEDGYNAGMSSRGAIYVQYPQAVPSVYAIDPDVCIGCGYCEKYCKANAVIYDDEPKVLEIDVGSMILSPGVTSFDPKVKTEYGYGEYPNVLSSIEFERVLSATGPYQGLVLRPSDGEIPRKVAFLQCVGSRDHRTNIYCSSVCCMYSMKEAVIAKEHCNIIEPTIFFMDIRAHGKEFDNYYLRAQEEHGIRFVRCRVSNIEEDPSDKSLWVMYYEDGEQRKEKFELVVLATGLVTTPSARRLADTLGVDLNKYNFVRTTPFSPLKTNVPGIFVSGAFVGPKDIPDTVAQASGAAAKASSVVAGARGTLVTEKEYPPERDVSALPPRIGVFVCHCGVNIGSVVNVPEVVEYAKTLLDVVYAEHNLYTCSQDTQERIKEKIEEHNLTRVVVASCTPRTHEPLFQNTCKEGGLNPYLFEMANIREHCSWIHMHRKEAATEKSKDLVRMAVGKARMHVPQTLTAKPVTRSGLVIGGGLSGMTAALGLAEQGFEAILVEKEDHLGGHLNHIQYMFEGEEDPQERLADITRRVRADQRVKVHLNSTVTDVEGSIGSFLSTISGPDSETKVEHGIVIIAAGGIEYVPTEYLYGKNDKVVTQSELEKLVVDGKVQKGKVRTAVMIQCVGARNKEHPNCSKICCGVAVKNALRLKDLDPEMEIFVLYRDVRTHGFTEASYREARNKGVHFIRYDDENMPQVSEDKKRLKVQVHDDILDRRIVIGTDLLVLSTAIHPNPDNGMLSTLLKTPLTKEGFFLEAHMKLRPVDFSVEGVYLCGLAHGPKGIGESVGQALGAVSRASTVLSKDEIMGEPMVAFVNEAMCSGCLTCVALCPFSAVEEEGGKAKVNELLCKGCGTCAATCRNSAITQRLFQPEEMISIIDAALEDMEVE